MALQPYFAQFKFGRKVEPDYRWSYATSDSFQPDYEGWAEPGTSINIAGWTIKKNYYDAQNRNTYSTTVQDAIWSQRSLYFNP